MNTPFIVAIVLLVGLKACEQAYIRYSYAQERARVAEIVNRNP